MNKKRKLTPEEDKLINDCADHAKWAEVFTVLFWSVFSVKKEFMLVDCLKDGMTWNAAFNKAKTICDL